MKARNPLWFRLFLALVMLFPGLPLLAQNGASPFYDYRGESTYTIHKFEISDLPPPNATKSANNFPEPYPRPADAMPKALPGFKVGMYVTGLDEPRELRAAPNGDVFLAEMSKGEIKIFRGVGKDGKPQQAATFAARLKRPFGMGFYPLGANPQWVHIANTDSVVRFPHRNGD